MSTRTVSPSFPVTSNGGVADVFPAPYIEMLARDRHHNPPAFLHSAEQMFQGVDLRGKQVLEIGSGRGLMTIYAALRGGIVTSLEPELVGATSGVIAMQRERVAQLGLSNVSVVAADFNTWDAGAQRFDVIFARATINHLYASSRNARTDRDTYQNYVEVARRIHRLLAPGGVFIATDACRHAFFTLARRFGVRRPWRRTRTGVDWRYHQNPGTWSRIFRDGGFGAIQIDYPVPYPLRGVPLMNTAAANFFLHGSFLLRAWR